MFSIRNVERNPRRRTASLLLSIAALAAPGAAQAESDNLPVEAIKTDHRYPCERQPMLDARSNPQPLHTLDGKTLLQATHWAAA